MGWISKGLSWLGDNAMNLLGIGTAAADSAMNYDIAQKNFRLQQDTFNYNKDLQQQIFAREDSAIQRRAADLKAAGLSQTLAAGEGAGAGSAVAVQAPQNDYRSDMLARLQAGIQMKRIAAEGKYYENLAANEGAKNPQIQAQTDYIRQQTATSKAHEILMGSQNTYYGWTSKQVEENINLAKQNTRKAMYEANLKSVEVDRAEEIVDSILRARNNEAELKSLQSQFTQKQITQAGKYLEVLEQQLAGLIYDNESKSFKVGNQQVDWTWDKLMDFMGLGTKLFGLLM